MTDINFDRMIGGITILLIVACLTVVTWYTKRDACAKAVKAVPVLVQPIATPAIMDSMYVPVRKNECDIILTYVARTQMDTIITQEGLDCPT